MCLWGDKLTAPDYVDSVREKLREQSDARVQIPSLLNRHLFSRTLWQRSEAEL